MTQKTITIKSLPLQPYQDEVYQSIKQHREDTIHAILSPRQYGKSYLVEMLLFDSCINYKNQVNIVIEPTLSQARKMATEMYNMVCATPIFKSYNAQLLELKFTNGSQILYKSVEQGQIALRGYTVTKNGYLVIDEAAYCDDELFYASTALCSRWKAPILLFSTPRWESGFYYDYCNTNDDKVFFHDWSKYKNPFISDEKLDMFRRQMPASIFGAEYLGLWMKNTSDVFGDFTKVMSNAYDGSNMNRIMAVDWGQGKDAKSDDSDYTAVSIMNGERQQIFLTQWNDLDETKTVDKIVDIATEWKVKSIVVENNSIGGVYQGLLKKRIAVRGLRIGVITINTTNELKNELVAELVVHIQNETVQLLDNNILKLQMTTYQMEKTKSGKVTYNAASGYHDDALFATMLNLKALRQGQYHIR